jgi:nitrite reductase/ring-hydroxylating ferredoxin subunit
MRQDLTQDYNRCPRCGAPAQADKRRKGELECSWHYCQAATTDGEWDWGVLNKQRGGK